MGDRARLNSKPIRTGFVSPWGDSTKGALIDRLKTEFGFYFQFTWATEEREKNDLVAMIIDMPQLSHANVSVFAAAFYTFYENGKEPTNVVEKYVLNTLYERLRVGGAPKSTLSMDDVMKAMAINVIRYIYAISMFVNKSEPANLDDIIREQEADLGEMDVDAEDDYDDDDDE